MARSIAEVAQSTRLLTGPLSRLAEGDTVSNDELSALIGMDVTKEGRPYLSSARKIVERDRNVVLVCVPKVGIKRLVASEISAIGDEAIGSIRRKARRTTTRLINGMKNAVLDNGALIAANARLSMLGAISMASSSKAVSQVEGAVKAANSKELAAGKVLEMFK